MLENTLKKALDLIAKGELTQALECYQIALRDPLEDNEKAELYRLLAIIHSQLNAPQQAQTAIDQALKLQPNDPNLWHTQAILSLKQEQIKLAIKQLKKAITINNNLPSLQTLGTLLYQQQQYEQAKTYFQTMIATAPNNDCGFFHMALINLQQLDNDQATKNLIKTLEINPDHAKAHGQLGQIYLQAKQYKKAAIHFTLRLNLEPHHAETWHSLGQTELYLGKFKEAIDSLKNCLADNSKHPQANQDLANAYVKLADYHTALTFYFRQLNINPSAESYYNIGVLLMYQEHNKDALEYLSHAIKLEPNNVDSQINIANIYLKQGQHDLAIEHYQQALQIKPNNPEIEHILAAIKQTDIPDKAPAEYLEHLFDQYAPFYDKHLVEQLQYNVPAQLLELIEHDHRADRSWTILDLGCGSGLAGKLFKPLARKLIGIDISAKMIDIASAKNLYDELKIADIHEALPAYHDIDCIVAADVFTYTGNLTTLIPACYQALRTGGLLAFSVEKSTDPGYQLQHNIRYAHHQDYILQTLQDSGFSHIEITPSILRQQLKKPVTGYLVLVQKPSLQ